jgi:CAAX protease family protein
LTHRLWMALGLHMAWDFANDGIFVVGVAGQSGQSLYGLLQASISGPKLLTGGALGIEGSIITLIVMLMVGILMLRIIHQRGQFTKSRKVTPIEVT